MSGSNEAWGEKRERVTLNTLGYVSGVLFSGNHLSLPHAAVGEPLFFICVLVFYVFSCVNYECVLLFYVLCFVLFVQVSCVFCVCGVFCLCILFVVRVCSIAPGLSVLGSTPHGTLSWRQVRMLGEDEDDGTRKPSSKKGAGGGGGGGGGK